MGVQRIPDGAHPSVHHVRRGHDVGPGAGMTERGSDQGTERQVIVDVATFDQSAMAVIGVRAEADVRHDHEFVSEYVFQSLDRPLDSPRVVGRCPPVGSLGSRRRLAEEQYRANAESEIRFHLWQKPLHPHAGDSRHGGHRLFGPIRRQDEVREHELVG